MKIAIYCRYAALSIFLLSLVQDAGAFANSTYESLVEPVGWHDDAEAALRAKLDTDGTGETHLELADVYLQQGDWKAGVDVIETAIDRWPDNQVLRRKRVDLLLVRIDKAGVFGMVGAGKALRQACEDDLAHDPANGDAMLCLARYFQQAPGIAGGSDRKAQEMVGKLRDLGGAPAHLYDAWQYREDGPARLAALQRAAVERPEPGLFVSLALALSADGHYEEAMACLARGLDLYPDHRMLLYQRGRISAVSGLGLKEGEAALMRFLSGPTLFTGRDFRASAHWRLGMVLAAGDRTEQARRAFRRALALEPGNDDFKAAMKQLDAEDA